MIESKRVKIYPANKEQMEKLNLTVRTNNNIIYV